MKKITSFDRQNLQEVRSYLQDKFKEMEKETGIKFSIGNISFTGQQFTSKITAFVPGETKSGEVILNKEQLEWNQNAFILGLKKEDFGKTIMFAGSSYEIVGVKPRSHKRPILIKHTLNGKVFKCTIDQVKMALNK